MQDRQTWDDRYPLLNAMYLHYGVVTITGAWAAGVDGPECVILANAAPLVVTLPLASESKGKAYYIKKIAAAVGVITVDAQPGDTIDGADPFAGITAQFDGVLIVSDGATGWWIIAETGPSF